MKRTVTSVFVGIMALLLLVTGFGCGKKAAPKIAVMLPETGSGISEETAAAVEEALFAVSVGNKITVYSFFKVKTSLFSTIELHLIITRIIE